MKNIPIDVNSSKLFDEHFHINVIFCAGFEDRTLGFLNFLSKKKNITLNHAVIIDYVDTELNEPSRTRLINAATLHFKECSLVKIDKLFRLLEISNDIPLFIDISGMNRNTIFDVIFFLYSNKIVFHIVYTEAQSYYPDYNFYLELKAQSLSNEVTILTDDSFEDADTIYSKDSNVVIPQKFSGSIEFLRNSVLIGFYTFKKSRLQAILNSVEFDQKFLLLSKPERDDLQWRRDFMELMNTDSLSYHKILKSDTSTLYVNLIMEEIDNILNICADKKCSDYFKLYNTSNVYIAPLGSKMQTLACLFTKIKYPDVSIIFSEPSKYYPNKFSFGCGNSFIIHNEEIISLIQ